MMFLFFQAKDISDFFTKSRRGQEVLPLLVARLIHESAPQAEACFPWGEHIGKEGYDGEVNNSTLNIPEVPHGKSVWEMGTNQDPKAKFKDDLKNRTKNPLGYESSETIFCFVTPHKFSNIQKEISNSPHKAVWKDIKIYDADYLESWLQKCPKTAFWLAGEMGKLPDKMARLEDFYVSYAQISRAKNADDKESLPPAMLLAGRKQNADHFLTWLKQKIPDGRHFGGNRNRQFPYYVLEGETAKEATAFIHSVLVLLSPLPPISGLVAHSKEAAEKIAQQDSTPNKNLILMITSPDVEQSTLQTLANKGWDVVWAVDKENKVSSEAQHLKLPWSHELRKSLENSFPKQKQKDYRWCSRTAAKSGRSLNRLISLLRHDAVRQKQEADKLENFLSAIIVGCWKVSAQDRDIEILEMLSGAKKWSDLEKIFQEEITANRLDGKIIKIGARDSGITYHLRAPEAELTALTDIFTDSDGLRLKEACLKLFQGGYSGLLTQGVSHSLAIMGNFPEDLPKAETMRSWAQEIVTEIFEQNAQNLNWWGSNDISLSHFAECVPEVFFKHAKNLISNYPLAFYPQPQPEKIDFNAEGVIRKLLEEEEKNKQIYLADKGVRLLWILSAFAWLPDYFCKTVDLLTEINKSYKKEKDFSSTSPNPFETLCDIFAPWNPQTSVSLQKRHKALEKIIKKNPELVWKILIDMLPNQAIMCRISPPSFRKLIKGENGVERLPSDPVLYKDYEEDLLFAAEKLVALAESDETLRDARWADLILHWENLFGANQYKKNGGHLLEECRIKTLETLRKRLEKDGAEMKNFRSALYRVLSKRRIFGHDDLVLTNPLCAKKEKARADWALSAAHVQELANLMPLILPQAAKEKFLWAFEREASSLMAILMDEGTREALSEEQKEALSEMLKKSSIKEICELAKEIKIPENLGWRLSESDNPKAKSLLGLLLNQEGQIGEKIAFGLYEAYPNAEELTSYSKMLWQQAIKENWGNLAEIRLLNRMEPSLELWQEIDKRPEQVQKAYWEKIYLNNREHLPAKEVFKRLKNHPKKIFDWLSNGKILNKLTDKKELVQLLNALSPADFFQNGADFYWLAEILSFLRKFVSRETLAELELKFYDILKCSHQGICCIYEELAEKPERFVEFILAAFLDKKDCLNEETKRKALDRQTDEEKEKGRKASQILDDWTSFRFNPNRHFSEIKAQFSGKISNQVYLCFPGWHYGEFEAEKLQNWIESVQKKLKNTGWEEVGNLKIGKIIGQMASFGEAVIFPKGLPEIFEETATEAMAEGVSNALFNRRGVFQKNLYEGGKQEESIARQYLKGAEILEDQGYEKLAKILQKLGEFYQKDAKKADADAERQDLTGIFYF